MRRPFNFASGPATLPEAVLRQAAEEMLDYEGTGVSVMEMHHRSDTFQAILQAALRDFRELLAIPSHYRILFLQGGASAMNALIPLNLTARRPAPATMDFIHTGHWSERALLEARKYGQVHIAATSRDTQFTTLPPQESWHRTPDAAYVHLCSNETIHGVEFQTDPDVGTNPDDPPLVADMSSNILSRVIDVSKYGVIFGGMQKNLGIAGLSFAIVREDLIGHALPVCPSVFDWKVLADHDSMYNTPPTYAIYITSLMLRWMKEQGGLAAIEQRNTAKARLLYDYLDASAGFHAPVATNCRSRMNVRFVLNDPTRQEAFLAGAAQRGLLNLRGHRALGGLRASLYNAMPLEGVEALLAYLWDFEHA